MNRENEKLKFHKSEIIRENEKLKIQMSESNVDNQEFKDRQIEELTRVKVELTRKKTILDGEFRNMCLKHHDSQKCNLQLRSEKSRLTSELFQFKRQSAIENEELKNKIDFLETRQSGWIRDLQEKNRQKENPEIEEQKNRQIESLNRQNAELKSQIETETHQIERLIRENEDLKSAQNREISQLELVKNQNKLLFRDLAKAQKLGFVTKYHPYARR